MDTNIRLSPANQSYPEPSDGLPLSGFRVVELTIAWAGPMAGRVLACLGAEVIHIEAANNLNSWRSYSALVHTVIQTDRVASIITTRAALFNSQNTDKLSLSLDLKGPGGKAAFRDLVAKADGLITNFTPGMLETPLASATTCCGRSNRTCALSRCLPMATPASCGVGPLWGRRWSRWRACLR